MFIGALKSADTLLGIYKAIGMCRVVHIPQAVCMFRKDLKRPKLSPVVDLETLKNEEIKAKTELSTAWLSVESMLQHSESSAKTERLLKKFLCNFWAFKEISMQSLAVH